LRGVAGVLPEGYAFLRTTPCFQGLRFIFLIGEAPAASNDIVDLGDLLVAAVVTALGDELARRVKLLPRLLF
jgi:hypothetical protein